MTANDQSPIPNTQYSTLSLANIHPEYSLWHYVWKLLRLRWRIFFSSFRHARLRRKIGTLILIVIVLAVLVGVFAASWGLLYFLRSPVLAQFIDPAPFLASVPVLVVSASFLGVLFTSFGVLLQALYLAGDMDFLLSSPVPIRAVFVTKMLQAILPNFGLVSLFTLPVLYGLGAAGSYNVLYFPLVVIILVALALAAAGLASLLVMSIVRVFPARRVAEVLGFVGGIISLLCSQSGQFTSRFSDQANFSQAQATQALETMTRFNTPWSPLAWAGRGLVDIGEGRWLTGVGFLLLTLGLAGACFVVALNTAERWYYTGWAGVQAGTRRKAARKPVKAAPPKAAKGATWVERLVPAQVRGMFVKDLVVLRRDLRNMSQLVTPLILGVIYAVMLIQGGGKMPAGRGEAPAEFMQTMNSVLVYGNVGISMFVGWTLLMRLAMIGFSQEGKQYWILKAAPMSTGKLLLAKFLVAYVPTLVLGWLFLFAISLMQFVTLKSATTLTALLFGLPVVALCFAGAAGVNLAFGVAGVNLEWEDPRQMMRGTIGCVGTLASFAYFGITAALFFGPPILVAALGGPEVAGQILGLALGGAVSLVCTFLPPWLVRDRVPQIGEA